ncbi:MAG: D-alanine--D-alanine ligase [Desulfuromonadaceae bacterium]|nr:D-alanine--D-alanine ligase [Desulfuromonadaceae bacterium]
MHVVLAFNLRDSAGADCFHAHSAVDDRFAEWDDIHTVQAVQTALSKRYQVTPVNADLEAFRSFRELRPDFVFNMAEGFNGASREAQIPAMLDMLGIPYTGSDPVTLGICLDKRRTKEILAYHCIPTARFVTVSSLKELPERFRYPLIVKPILEGSSKGVTDRALVHGHNELKCQVSWALDNYRQPVLVEEYLPGREFTVALLGNGADLRALPIVEIDFGSLPQGANPIYSYEAKWIWDTEETPLPIFACPAQVEPLLARQIEEVCRRAFTVLGCRDWCRIDVRLDAAGVPNVIELNPLPGILPRPEQNSCFPKAARAAGLSYDDLILTVADTACRRLGLTQGGADERRCLL